MSGGSSRSRALRERNVYRTATGYRVQFSSGPTKTFSASRYGSDDAARLAAIACRNHYLETGDLVAPMPPKPSMAQWARHFDVPTQEFYARVRKDSLDGAIEYYREQARSNHGT